MGALDHCLVSFFGDLDHCLAGALGWRSVKELLGVLAPDADEEARQREFFTASFCKAIIEYNKAIIALPISHQIGSKSAVLKSDDVDVDGGFDVNGALPIRVRTFKLLRVIC